ncbi:hypothetical protein ACFL2G_02490 [Candidatus Omnitrophota bacterium]
MSKLLTLLNKSMKYVILSFFMFSCLSYAYPNALPEDLRVPLLTPQERLKELQGFFITIEYLEVFDELTDSDILKLGKFSESEKYEKKLIDLYIELCGEDVKAFLVDLSHLTRKQLEKLFYASFKKRLLKKWGVKIPQAVFKKYGNEPLFIKVQRLLRSKLVITGNTFFDCINFTCKEYWIKPCADELMAEYTKEVNSFLNVLLKEFSYKELEKLNTPLIYLQCEFLKKRNIEIPSILEDKLNIESPLKIEILLREEFVSLLPDYELYDALYTAAIKKACKIALTTMQNISITLENIKTGQNFL